jgi:metallo-beta-lactamase family protein
LLETGGKKILLDCGLYQGRRDESRERNSHFPFAPGSIDAMILSHAHTDHCGNLPNLVRQGYRGPIYCTPATKDLAAVMLADSAKIQEEDADYLNRQRSHGQPRIEPLYTREDAHRAIGLCHPVPYDKPFDLKEGVQLRFVDAGHLLGSAMVSLKGRANGRDFALTFTGDLGRKSLPILRDPAPVPPGDLLISEATYGGRSHPPVESLADSLAQVVKRTVDRGGKILVPAFSLGRTQTVIYYLHQLFLAGRLPPIPIYVDSPLAANATEVFRLHPECFDEETLKLVEEDPDVFGGQRVQYVHSVEESKALNGRRDSCLIIAASGMCETGRILHHLKHNVEDPRNTILIIGYQAPDTLGARIMNHAPEVRIHDRLYKLKAEVVIMSGFSSHADHQDLVAFLGPLAQTTKEARLVHCEMEQAQALAKSLGELGFKDVQIPARGESVEI